MRLVYAERARRDIGEIYEYNARRSIASARRIETTIRAACELAAEFPLAAPATDEPLVRRAPMVRYPYTIYYRVDASLQTVEIARVVYSPRIRDLGKVPSD